MLSELISLFRYGHAAGTPGEHYSTVYAGAFSAFAPAVKGFQRLGSLGATLSRRFREWQRATSAPRHGNHERRYLPDDFHYHREKFSAMGEIR
jgi:hypothetical protein